MKQAKTSLDETNTALTTRMNSIAKGVTTDTEILDARVGHDNKTYDNLGEAIRSIVPELQTEFEDARLSAHFFDMPAAVEPEIAVDGYYIDQTYNSLVSYEPYLISESIQVQEGDVVAAKLHADATVGCIAYYNPETDKYSGSIAAGDAEEVFFPVTLNGWVRLCYLSEYGCSFRVIHPTALYKVIQRVVSLEADDAALLKLKELMDMKIGEKQTAEIAIEGWYVNPSGGKQAYEECYITAPVAVKRGDYVIVKMYVNGAVSQIAYCNEAGTGGYKKILNETDGGEEREISALITQDGYICFSANTGHTTTYQIIRSGKLVEIFDAFAAEDAQIALHEERLDELNIIPENLLIQRSRNLFNKDEIITGFYIQSAEGILVDSPKSAVSGYIPVEPGKVYALKRSAGKLNTYEVRYLTEDKKTQLQPLNADGTSRGDLNFMAMADVITMAPEGAAYCQFTINFAGNSANYDAIQFEEGSKYTDYVPYLSRPYIGYGALPADLDGLSEAHNDLSDAHNSLEAIVGRLLKGVGTEEITLANSGKIGVFSNSFVNGYTMRTHHVLDNIGMWSDYIFCNYGHSGDDALETLARINANEAWLGKIPVQDLGLTYGVIAMQDNDGALFAADRETYRENFKKLAEAIRAMGAIPILGTEHDSTENYYGLMALAQEEGYLFMNWGRMASSMGLFAPFWHNSHPATRTHWLWTYGMKPYLDTLPRPDRGIKLFRKRPDTAEDDLMFNNLIERAERYVEIYSGYSCLTRDTEKYFDRLTNGKTSYEDVYSEYQKLQSGGSVNFGTHALIECVTPYTAGGIDKLYMTLSATGVEHTYIRRILSPQNPLPDKRYVAFGVTAGADLLTPGTTFNITGGVFNSNMTGAYTVDQVVDNVVVTTTSSDNKTPSGTDTPVCSISGVTMAGSYDYPSADYMLRFDRPLGEWEEITLDESGKTDLTEHLKHCMDYDKVSMLLTGTGIVVSGISFTAEGYEKKRTLPGKPMPVYKEGESLITDTKLDAGTAWKNIDSVPIYSPVISAVDNKTAEPLPSGITTVRVLSEGDTLTQAYDRTKLGQDSYHSDHIQIRVLARYFPEYIDTDAKWEQSEIYEGSYDCAQMSVIIDGKTRCARTQVGAFWNEFIFDVQFENGYTSSNLIIRCDKKSLQVAKAEMVLVKGQNQ